MKREDLTWSWTGRVRLCASILCANSGLCDWNTNSRVSSLPWGSKEKPNRIYKVFAGNSHSLFQKSITNFYAGSCFPSNTIKYIIIIMYNNNDNTIFLSRHLFKSSPTSLRSTSQLLSGSCRKTVLPLISLFKTKLMTEDIISLAVNMSDILNTVQWTLWSAFTAACWESR